MALGLGNGDARAFLRRALDPPTDTALEHAAAALHRVGALKGGAAPPPVGESAPQALTAPIRARVDAWTNAKKVKDYKKADAIRDELRKAAIDVERAAAQMRQEAGAPAAAAAAAAAAAGPSPQAPLREELTPLGSHLARMPLEPRVGKILIYGALLGCIDPALTIAAAMSLSRSPFLTPHERRQEAATARADFVRDRSDHLALLRAYEAWELEYEL
jgi:HrpA-like RNA helicase